MLPPTRTIEECTEPVDAPTEPVALRTIGGRYELLSQIGVGGHGEVWSAHDALTGAEVAVKLLKGVSPSAYSPRVRREIAALRLLHVPGVVRLLDEGAEGDKVFVVMERLHGESFPGRPTPCAWDDIAETTVALLETLGRIHAAGVVHRDLKPANVLVDASGRPTVLDFGVAWAPFETVSDGPREVVGTPAYLAPEQVASEPIGPGTDLYAVGVMLFEALSGHTPFESEALTAMVYARVFRDAEPLRTRCPTAPRVACETVDALLRRRLEERPRSAADVIRMLRGHRVAHEVSGLVRIAPPRLGGDATVRAVVDAARARASIDVVGPAGSGRTRALGEAMSALESAGIQCVRAGRGSTPFASLERCLGGLDALHASGLDEVLRAVDERLAALLSGAAALFVDDAEEVDAWSSAAIERALPHGAVVRALRARSQHPAARVETLGALTRDDLAALFHGPERVFHLPSDAARALWTRTGGLAARVSAEVAAWVRAGVARWEGSQLKIDRRSLDALALGGIGPRVTALRASGLSVSPRPSLDLAGDLAEMLEWVLLASPTATASLLARVTGLASWRVEASLVKLEAMGRARRSEVGTWEPSGPAATESLWTPQQRRSAHAALAETFEPGTEGRLSHLVAAACLGETSHDGADEGFARALALEAVALAKRRAREGSLGPATAALAEGLMAARRLGLATDAPEHRALLATWVEVALAEGTPYALDRAHYELCRSAERTDSLEHLASLVRAALAARSGGERGLELADAVEPFEDLGLELCRHGVRVLAARRASIEREEAVVEALRPWAGSLTDPRAHASLIDWLGRLRYRQSRFEEAAVILDAGVRPEAPALQRMAALAGGASAWLEALRPDLAMARAQSLRDEAARCRHVYFEAWAEHLIRASAYRAGVAMRPSIDQVELLAMVGVKDLEALAALDEAANAWRSGDMELTRSIATRACTIWAASGWAPGAGISRALAVAAGAEVDREDLEALIAWALGCELPRLGVQVLGLLARAGLGDRAAMRDAARAFASTIPLAERATPLEVLSIAEALAYCEG